MKILNHGLERRRGICGFGFGCGSGYEVIREVPSKHGLRRTEEREKRLNERRVRNEL